MAVSGGTQRMVDKNSVRGGAGLSAVVLLVGFVLDVWVLVPAMALAVGMGSVLGLRYSPLGAAYRSAKKLGLRMGVDPEPEPPPRFAQTLGFVVLGLGSIAFLLGAAALGWVLALLVAALQGLLAATGLCVGCEIYLFSQRFLAKGA